MRFLVLIILQVFCVTIYSQTNISQASHIDYQTLHNANLNDVWGYVDEFGNEYAIVGTSKGTSIVNVSNPQNPVEVFWIEGSASIWRDPCVYGDYAYITTEAQDGLTIIDLSPLPFSTTLNTFSYTGPQGGTWLSAHTCFVDENGIAYIFGSNRGNGGVIMLDVLTNPTQPLEVGIFDNWYVHDGFVRNDTMFLAHISDGFFSLVDVSDKSNPVLLGTQITPNNFSHNIWPSDNGQTVFTTDEISGAYIAAYNIADPLNIFEIDRIQNSPGQGVIPHNTHVRGDYLITSYYSDGIVIHDITYPYNIIKVASFDTYPTQTAGFDGCWGVYPFLPSGTILASDITQGLFILTPTYEKASYLEGVVTDASTALSISGVQVNINGSEQTDLSRSDGFYATGILGQGSFTVTYSKVGYYPQSIMLNLSQGAVLNNNVQLVPIPPFSLTVNVLEAGTSNVLSDAQILLKVPLIEHQGITNASGQENFTLYYQDEYSITVGKWGYLISCVSQVINTNTGTITIELQKGYQDEFSFDLGWLVNGSATSGLWERGVPFATNSGSAPGIDSEFDCTNNAFVTGNDPQLDPDIDDLDGGYTSLFSPTMDLTSYSDPHLFFQHWFFCLHGNPPDDTLRVYVSNGLQLVEVAKFGSNPSQFGMWNSNCIRLSDFIPITNSMQVSFRVSDYNPNVNITEAGVDYFLISNSNILAVNEIKEPEYTVYPNPTANQLWIKSDYESFNFELFDMKGQRILIGHSDYPDYLLDMNGFSKGIYSLRIGSIVKKVIKE